MLSRSRSQCSASDRSSKGAARQPKPSSSFQQPWAVSWNAIGWWRSSRGSTHPSPTRSIFQVPDGFFRIRRSAVLAAMDQSASPRSLLLRFAQVMNTQTSFTALSNAVHQLDEPAIRVPLRSLGSARSGSA
jgi:hypothetical protein